MEWLAGLLAFIDMFLGEYTQAIDEKGQISLPTQFTGALAAGLIVTRGFDRNLMVFTKQRWEDFAGELLKRPLSSQQLRNLRRRLFSDAATLSPDRKGRIYLPFSLRDFANLNGEAVLTGMGDYIEVWNAEYWTVMREGFESDGDVFQWETVGV